MQIITYISDWKSNDYYPAIFKGVVFNTLEQFRELDPHLVELGHGLKARDIVSMCFIVKNSFENFPQGTVHLLCVNSEPSVVAPMVICKYKDHYFIGADDGRFSLIFDGEQSEAYHLPLPDKFSTFMMPHYCAIAIKLIIEEKWNCGSPHTLRGIVGSIPVVLKDAIIGKVIFIDSYGNAITNINKELFTKSLVYMHTENGDNVDFVIHIQGPYLKINKICENYTDIISGGTFALFNSLGLLELGINCGDFVSIEGVELNSEVSIIFKSSV